MKIYTELRVIQHKRLVAIGSLLQCLTGSAGATYLARFEAPLRRRAERRYDAIVHARDSEICNIVPHQPLVERGRTISRSACTCHRQVLCPSRPCCMWFAAVITHLYCNIAGVVCRMTCSKSSTTAGVRPGARFVTSRFCAKFLGSLLNIDYDANGPAKSAVSMISFSDSDQQNDVNRSVLTATVASRRCHMSCRTM